MMKKFLILQISVCTGAFRRTALVLSQHFFHAGPYYQSQHLGTLRGWHTSVPAHATTCCFLALIPHLWLLQVDVYGALAFIVYAGFLQHQYLCLHLLLAYTFYPPRHLGIWIPRCRQMPEHTAQKVLTQYGIYYVPALIVHQSVPCAITYHVPARIDHQRS